MQLFKSVDLTGSWTVPYDGTIVIFRIEIKLDSPGKHTLVRTMSDEDTGELKDLQIVYTRDN